MQQRPTSIIRLVHGHGLVALGDPEAGLGDLAGDAVFPARELFTVLAVADRGAGLLVRVVQRDLVPDLAAVAAAGDGLGHAAATLDGGGGAGGVGESLVKRP
jgi:hypothetical protein